MSTFPPLSSSPLLSPSPSPPSILVGDSAGVVLADEEDEEGPCGVDEGVDGEVREEDPPQQRRRPLEALVEDVIPEHQ